MSKTRTPGFGFPNNGHSVRKLVHGLRSLGDVKVKLIFEYWMHDLENFDICFEVTDSSDDYHVFNALLLADKLQSMGTRFTAEIKYQEVQLSFHTKWSDIAHNPKEYGVL